MPRRRPASSMTVDAKALIDSTAEAAFASDESCRITVWNQAAEALTGHAASKVVGKRCFDVIRGRDLFGNRFCNGSCAVRKMRRHREPIHPFQIRIATRTGDTQQVTCSVIVASKSRRPGYTLIHLIHPISGEKGCESPAPSKDRPATRPSSPDDATKQPNDPVVALTPREIQILRLVASGTETREIAKALGISRATVSNHIQHVLGKLDVHNKLRAVFVARRDGMI